MVEESASSAPEGLSELFARDTLERNALNADVLSRMFGDVDPGLQQSLGRYEVLRRLGSGGMGVVYLAFDPELDRQVAIKLLRRHRDRERAADTELRLRDEARAMARINHAHVVHVHDVGRHGDQLFIAMEYVEGSTLKAWLKTPRPWAKCLQVFIDAGEGLAAAHEAGLLHRDFKPDNVMIGSDGVVKVTDFGIARAMSPWQTTAESTESADPSESTDSAGSSESAELDSGNDTPLAGTLGYMSPEQLLGQAQDARSDQFAFCVALHEALFGRHPFAHQHPSALLAAIITAAREPLPSSHGVPRWLIAAVRRGMSADPAQRWPSMRALLERLRDDPVGRRRRWMLGAAGLVGLGLGATVIGGEGLRRWRYERALDGCTTDARGVLGQRWDDAARARLREGLLATGLPFASTTADLVVPQLDTYTERWVEAHTAMCVATRVEERWSTEIGERARWCLDERRYAFEALVDELSEADETALLKAGIASMTLDSVDICRDAVLLERMPNTPANVEQARRIQSALSRVDALRLSGADEEALAASASVADDARDLGWPPLMARANARRGRMMHVTGDYQGSKATLLESYFVAREAGDEGLAADVAVELVEVVGHRLADYEAGLTWARHAEVGLETLGAPDDDIRRADLAGGIAKIYAAQARYALAGEYNRRALSIRESKQGESHPSVANLLSNLGIHLFKEGKYDEARAAWERAQSIYEVSLGSDHPNVAEVIGKIGTLHHQRGEYDDAKRHYLESLERREDAFGATHPSMQFALNNLAVLYAGNGENQLAISTFERILKLQEKMLGPDNPVVATTLNNLATAVAESEDYARAQQIYERSRSILEAKFGSMHPEVATALMNLGELDVVFENPESARRRFEQALEILVATVGPDHADLVRPLCGLAELDYAQGDFDAAVEHGERVLDILAATTGEPIDRARASFVVGRALWDSSPAERGRARAMVEGTPEVFPPQNSRRDRARLWLESHPWPPQ